MAQNLIDGIDSEGVAKIEGETKSGSEPENSENAKTGVDSARGTDLGGVVRTWPQGESVSEWTELIAAKGGAEILGPSGAEDTESGYDNSPGNTAVEAGHQSERRWFPRKRQKVIAALVFALFISLVVCGLKRWHVHPVGDLQRATYSTAYRAPITKGSADVLDLAGFVVLLAENEDRAYLSLSISVKLSNSDVYREMENKKTFLRGVIYGILDKAAKAGSPQIIRKEQLKRDITCALNRFLVTGTVDDIYFTKFLVV